MPVYSRKQLRRDLSSRFIYDMPFPALQAAQSATVPQFEQGTAWYVGEIRWADYSQSGNNLYQGAWLFVEGSANLGGGDVAGTFYQYLIASWNCGSGAFMSQQPTWEQITPSSMVEIHVKVPPRTKNDAVDDTLQRIRLRQEVAINTVDGALVYTIDGAASPNYLEHILDVHLMANPNNSLDLDLRHMQDWQVVTTATGRELRLKWGVKGSQQIVFDAIVIPSLSGGEDATINLPDERWILAGAAMRCYDFMIQNAPGQQVSQLMQRRAEWAAEYTRLSAKFMPTYEEPIRLHDVVRGMTPRPWDSASNFW